MSVLSDKHFHDEAAAYAFVEARIWPDGRSARTAARRSASRALKGKSTRIGVCKCCACRKPFTVKVGTIFERQPRRAASVAAGDLPACLQQEGHQQPTSFTAPWA